MGAIGRIAYNLNIRDEKPNQLLAKELVNNQDTDGIREIVEFLSDKNASIRSDCIKVLYEVGYLNPTLIAPYVKDFLDLLDNNQNRMVWGGMIALSTIAGITSDL